MPVKPFSLSGDNTVSCPFPAGMNEFGAGKSCQCSKGLFGPENHYSTGSQLASPTHGRPDVMGADLLAGPQHMHILQSLVS